MASASNKSGRRAALSLPLLVAVVIVLLLHSSGANAHSRKNDGLPTTRLLRSTPRSSLPPLPSSPSLIGSAAALRRALESVPRGGDDDAKSIEPLPPPADAKAAVARHDAEEYLEEVEAEEQGLPKPPAAASPGAVSSPAVAAAGATAPAPVTTPDHTKSTSTKLTNFAERAPPAILMGGAVYLLLKYGGEPGLIALVLLLQVGMYHESTSIIESYHADTFGTPRPSWGDQLEKWWWFGTVIVGTSLRNVVERTAHIDTEAMDLLCYGMVVVGLVGAVVGMARHAEAGPERFRDYLGTVAGCHFSLLFLVGQSSFWIRTVHEFGLEWVIYPALLVIVNDTMAYVFGLTMGKHKLLPRLSPKKTVEGFVGAALSTVAVAVPLLRAILSGAGVDVTSTENIDVVKTALAMGAFTSLISPFGGFLASAVKRAHGAKDFGTLIPGHGGVVDRFDCQIVTAPFVYLFLKYVEYKRFDGGV